MGPGRAWGLGTHWPVARLGPVGRLGLDGTGAPRPTARSSEPVAAWPIVRRSASSADLATTAKGYAAQAEGHITIVVDRSARTLLVAFIGGPGASELIQECVLAVKLRVPLAQLADTIHAFPTAARVMGNLFMQVHRELEGGVDTPGLTRG